MSPPDGPEGEGRSAQHEGTPVTWKNRFALGAYSLLLRLLIPAYLWRLWRRGRAEPMYRYRIAERLGFYGRERSSGWVWVHAVSLGETRAAAAMIQALRAASPEMRLLLTHGTGTGHDAGIELLREGDLQTWLPIDTPGAVRRFFGHFLPVVGVLMETEVWPNLLLAARAKGIPIVLASARLSERSQRRGARFDSVMRPVAETVALVLAQTEADAVRLRERGAPRVKVAGNLKFDMAVDPLLIERGREWRSLVGREVVLAAVTREGEEALLLEAWTSLPPPRPLLVIVPRHPQRFYEVFALIASVGLTSARRSAWKGPPPAEAFAVDVWLGDSMREMALYYGLAQVALLGGSFAPLGGQNLIEAAACGCPVVMGPHTFNFSDAAEGAREAGAALRAADLSAAVAAALALLVDPVRLATTSENALRFAAQHRGAAQRMAARIVELLPGGDPGAEQELERWT